MSRHSRRLSVRLRNIALFSMTSALVYQHWSWCSNSSITSSLPPTLYAAPSSSSRWWTREERIAHITSGTFSSSSSVGSGASPCFARETPRDPQAVTHETDEVAVGKSPTTDLPFHRRPSENTEAGATLPKKATHSSPPPVEESMQDGVWDVLVVGGGLIGLYTALEAAQRGLRVAVVEAQDVGSGNTSQSPGTAPGPLAYMQRALRQREFAWLVEACRVLRRDRMWSAVTASPFFSSSSLSSSSSSSLSVSSLPFTAGTSSVCASVPPVWSAQSIGIVTHHFTEWWELTISSVLCTLLTYGCGYAYGPSFSWPSRWISATRWNQTMEKRNTEGAQRVKKQDGGEDTTTATPPAIVRPTASSDTPHPSTEKRVLEGEIVKHSPSTVPTSSCSSSLPHPPPSHPVPEEEEEEATEPVYGTVCSRDMLMHGPHLAVRLARTAEALGVCILTYAPLVSLQWVNSPPSPLAEKTPWATVDPPNSTTTIATEPEGRGGASGIKTAQRHPPALLPFNEPSSPWPFAPFFEATVMDLLSPSVSPMSSSKGLAPPSAALRTVRARCVINCAGAWVEEVRGMLPETAHDPTPHVLEDAAPLHVKSYLVVPRDAIQSQPTSKNPPLKEESPPFSSSSSSSSSSSLLHRLHLNGLQVSPTLYSFSPTLILPWVNDCVLLGPSSSLLPSLPSWRQAYATCLASLGSSPDASSWRKEKPKKKAEEKTHHDASSTHPRKWTMALSSCLPPSKWKAREHEHSADLVQDGNSMPKIPSHTPTSHTAGNQEEEEEKKTVFPPPPPPPPPLGYRMHMTDGFAAARCRILHALEASHIHVDPDKVLSCVSSWAPRMRSPVSYASSAGSEKSGASMEGPFSSSQMVRLSHYLFHGYHIGVTKATRRPPSSSTTVACSSKNVVEVEEDVGERSRSGGEERREAPSSSSPSITPRRSPLMEVVAGERVEYRYPARNVSTGEDDGESGKARLPGVVATIRHTLFGASSSTKEGVQKTCREHCGDTERPDASLSLSYENIPFLHVYGGIPSQARDIALDVLQKAFSLSPRMAFLREGEESLARHSPHPSHRRWWWRSIPDVHPTPEMTVGREGGEGVRRNVVESPLGDGRRMQRTKPLVLLPLPWETSQETPQSSDADDVTPSRTLSWYFFPSFRGNGLSSWWSHSKAEEGRMRSSTSALPLDTTTRTNYTDHLEEEKRDPNGKTDGDVANAVRMMVRYGYAEKVSDVLFRRLRVAYCNPGLAALAARGVAEVMGRELHWSRERIEEEIQEVLEDIESITVTPLQ